jgi:hypothetical protein
MPMLGERHQANRRETSGTIFKLAKVLFLLAALGFAAQARATTVGCGGASGTYDFSTLAAAISGASLSNNTITIYGTCTEDVVITGAQNLVIAGAPGAVLADAGSITVSAAGVLEIDNSQNVTIQNLKILLSPYGYYGPFPGIAVNGSSLRLISIDIEGNTGTDGIDAGGNSNVQMAGNNVIENNDDGQGNGEGISLAGPASNLSIGPGIGNPGCTLIENNGGDGIAADGQASVNIVGNPNFCATIQNNGGIGVFLQVGSTGHIANVYRTPVITISGNQIGVVATRYSFVSVSGPLLIQDNKTAGVWLLGAGAKLAPSGGSPLGPTIESNGASAPACCIIAGGVSIEGNSNLGVGAGVSISNNSGPGIVVQDDSSALISPQNVGLGGPITISQNSIGISVANSSTLRLTAPTGITGNSGGDIVCGLYSVAYGNFSGVGRIVNCNPSNSNSQ